MYAATHQQLAKSDPDAFHKGLGKIAREMETPKRNGAEHSVEDGIGYPLLADGPFMEAWTLTVGYSVLKVWKLMPRDGPYADEASLREILGVACRNVLACYGMSDAMARWVACNTNEEDIQFHDFPAIYEDIYGPGDAVGHIYGPRDAVCTFSMHRVVFFKCVVCIV